MNIILIEEITPNSFSVSLFVNINAAKPEAVDKLVSNVILPILLIILYIALILLLCFLYSL